jgi:hypothetical protein
MDLTTRDALLFQCSSVVVNTGITTKKQAKPNNENPVRSQGYWKKLRARL